MGFKDIMKTVKNEAGDAVEVTKLKAKISKEKTTVKDNYEKIGEIIYNRYHQGGADAELAPMIEEINAARTRIDEYNQEISKVKID